MRRFKKVFLILIVLLIISQIPFAYRLYKLKRLRNAIAQLNSRRLPTADDSFTEYLGVMHVHSFLGGHSAGTFEEIISAAQKNKLNFVVLTEHPSGNFDTSAMTLKDVHGGVLFVNGNEVALKDRERLLMLPGNEAAARAGELTAPAFIEQAHANGALTFVAYPQDFKNWSAPGYDGVEVYNLFTNSRRINPAVMFFDGLWSYRSSPEFLFANFYERPTEGLSLWDKAMTRAQRRLVATAGNDAHANVGLSLVDSTGKHLAGIQLDPYERSFQLVRMHVLLPKGQELNTQTLMEALRSGHCFIAFDILGDASGFRFDATNGTDSRIQGDELTLSSPAKLVVTTPLPSRLLVFRDGDVVHEEFNSTRAEFEVKDKGVYRVEAYLWQLPHAVSRQPWIISNPIYVK